MAMIDDSSNLNPEEKTMKETSRTMLTVAVLALVLGGQIRLCKEYSEEVKENIALRQQIEELNSTIVSMQMDKTSTLSKTSDVEAQNRELEETNNQLLKQVEDLTIKLQTETMEHANDLIEAEIALAAANARVYNVDPDNITEVSGLSADQFNQLIDKILDSKGFSHNNALSNKGEAFEQVESEYGINGIYILAIFGQESAFATRCINTNNFGGIRASRGWKYFETPADCILYEGDLLKRSYVDKGLITLDDIGAKYCEGSEWPSAVGNILDEYLDYAEEVIEA